MKKAIFSILMVTPFLSILASVLYFVFFTNLPQLLYLHSIRNIYFDCMVFVSDYYVYKMRPGECKLNNIEHSVTLTHDVDGFRNAGRPTTNYDVAVIGDSHAHGFGVQDDETFPRRLESDYNYRTLNLAIGSYATMRELETLQKYGKKAKYVVIQYCDNDPPENEASLRLSKADLKSQVEDGWKAIIANYHQGKTLGYRKLLSDLVHMLRNHSFQTKSDWRRTNEQRNMQQEAALFAQIVARYRELLEGKRLVILEVATWGLNSPNFEAAFGSELEKLGWLRYKLVNTASVLNLDDYFFLDDHINRNGHRKLAAAVAREIAQWESREPLIKAGEGPQ